MQHFHPKSYFVCDLNVIFHNPRTTPSDQNVSEAMTIINSIRNKSALNPHPLCLNLIYHIPHLIAAIALTGEACSKWTFLCTASVWNYKKNQCNLYWGSLTVDICTLYTVEHRQLCISRQSVQFCSARPRPISSTLPKCGDILRLWLRPCRKFLLCIMVGQQMFDIVHTKGEMSQNCQSFIELRHCSRKAQTTNFG